MPLSITFWRRGVRVSIEKFGEDTLFRMTDEETDETNPIRIDLDVYALRDQFLGLGTKADAMKFLLAAGGVRLRDSIVPEDRLLWSSFQIWQIVVRAIMSNGSLPDYLWSQGSAIIVISPLTSDAEIASYALPSAESQRFASFSPLGLSIEPYAPSTANGHRRRLRAQTPVNSILQGILTKTFLDSLNGMKSRLCSLADCMNMSEVTSKHERQYCSQACAHHASVRRRRASTAKAKTHGKRTRAEKGKAWIWRSLSGAKCITLSLYLAAGDTAAAPKSRTNGSQAKSNALTELRLREAT